MKISDYTYLGSTVGNAYFSGLTLEDVFKALLISENKEQLDAAISASIQLKQIQKGHTFGKTQ